MRGRPSPDLLDVDRIDRIRHELMQELEGSLRASAGLPGPDFVGDLVNPVDSVLSLEVGLGVVHSFSGC